MICYFSVFGSQIPLFVLPENTEQYILIMLPGFRNGDLGTASVTVNRAPYRFTVLVLLVTPDVNVSVNVTLGNKIQLVKCKSGM